MMDDEAETDQNRPFAAKMKYAVLSIASTRPASLIPTSISGGLEITFLTVQFADECLNKIPKFSLAYHD